MTPKSRLDDAWAKLERAEGHVDSLRIAVGRFADGQEHPIETRRHFDPERSVMSYTAWPGLPDDAGLIVGNAVSDFRSALNYAAWQLAIDHLGREPDETQAPSIQFPMIDKAKGHSWPSHPHRKFMSDTAADVVKKFQPFQLEAGLPDTLSSPLTVLRELSNHDKHRAIQVAAFGAFVVRGTIPHESTLRDCRYAPGEQNVLELPDPEPLRDGSEVANLFVIPTGSHPDVDLQAQVVGKAVFGKPNWDLMPSLDAIGATCTEILSELEPLLKPRS